MVNTHTHTQPFYGPFSGTTKFLWTFMVQGENNGGRHTDHLAGRHSIQISQRPTSIIPSFWLQMPFLPQPSHSILAWDRHEICWLG